VQSDAIFTHKTAKDRGLKCSVSLLSVGSNLKKKKKKKTTKNKIIKKLGFPCFVCW